MHQVCVDNIKALACKVPILHPIDPSNDELIWVIFDASVSGIGAVYRQGLNWLQICRIYVQENHSNSAQLPCIQDGDYCHTQSPPQVGGQTH